ncbi:MAG: hypothetical protein V3U76_07040 [Granulosicoccus sp.]
MTQFMKQAIATALLISSTGPVLATGDQYSRANRFTEYAEVISSHPVYRDVSIREPRQECWTEQERHVIRYEGQPTTQYRRRSSGSGDVVVGGLIGGVIGNQLGRRGGSGTRAGATVAGAIIGSALASESGGNARHRREQRHETTPQTVYETRPVEHCRSVTDTRWEQRVQHYDVTYRYMGKTFTTRTNREPGSHIELQISVSPVRQ